MFRLNNIVKAADLSGYYANSLPCPTCNDTTEVFVTPPQLFAYNQGAYIHDVLSAYGADVRERFITGYCDDCWGNLFQDIDYDDEEFMED